ncbi:AAA family ATPase [Ochrobactrum sp. BTU1]|nr:AAA family ATPase [Ochrobactrum sp. BTU1]
MHEALISREGDVTTDKQGVLREIHLLTTDVLLSELVNGCEVSLGGEKRLGIASPDARAMLDWYRRNPKKWAANLNGDDVEVLIDLVGSEPPSVAPAAGASNAPSGSRLRLLKLRAHRFAGLHVYGKASEPPEIFEFEPEKPITLLEGANGSGKTSIANAIVWCLTGHLIRSQRAPEQGPVEFLCEISHANGSSTKHPMSAITPLPHAYSDLPVDGAPISADSWVELTFCDAHSNPLPPVLRRQERTPRGKIVEVVPDFAGIDLDPIAWRIATTMPALLPYLSVGSTSQLGEAVARLTGLADLVDLAKHSDKVSDRITTRTLTEQNSKLEQAAQQYLEQSSDLLAIVNEHSDMAIECGLPVVEAADAKDKLDAISNGFADLKAARLAGAREVLDETFDPEDKQSRDGLERSVRPAIEQVKQLFRLPAIVRLLSLKLDKEQTAKVAELVGAVETEAATLAELVSSPDLARRAQLYARVSGWMHDHDEAYGGKCPICIRSLEGTIDPVTGREVTDHLTEAAKDRDIIARTVAEWSTFWLGRLLRELPESFSKEARRDLPSSPVDLMREGFLKELFETESMSGTLAGLSTDAVALFNKHAVVLSDFNEPVDFKFPEQLSAANALEQMVARINRAVAFTEWMETNSAQLRKLSLIYQKGEDGSEDADRAISKRLTALLAIVEGATPLNSAIDLVGRMLRYKGEHTRAKTRIEACGKAKEALAIIAPLGGLAQTQVDALRTKLHKRSEHWRKEMFRNATEFAPELTSTGMDAKGILELRVGRQGVDAPAQHISNASALRGALLGFFLAFREHVLAKRGGLETLVLDDPQELLDNDNRERLARGLSKLARSGAQLLVTTHDRKFARSVVGENRADDVVSHVSVHPVNAVRPTLRLSPAIEEVDRKREEFFKNPDDAILAQDYASALRVFLEGRLGDIFDEFTHPAYSSGTKALTLFPLLDKLKGLVADGEGELFTSATLKRFADNSALASGAEARRVLNNSHHDKASISYMDVKNVASQFAQLRSSIEDVHQQFRYHRWREPLAPDTPADNVVGLKPMTRLDFAVPLCPDIAAFAGKLSDAGSQDVAEEQLIGEWFDSKSLYFIRGETLGFAIPSGSVAIVESEPYPGRDQNLVIARPKGQILARRLIRATGSTGLSLAAQMPDPRQSRKSLIFDDSKVKLHRIVGAIFSTMPPPKGGDEATEIADVPELSRITIAYRVKEESAVPLALPGQIVLGGDELNASDLDAWEGHLVAVSLNTGVNVFKRIGARLTGRFRHLRQFETIGGLGSSVLIATEQLDDTPDVPVMMSARKVIGVLYD